MFPVRVRVPPQKKKGVITPFLIRGESTLIKENEKKSKIINKIEISGKVEHLFCPSDNGLLIFDRESGFHKCIRCHKYWKFEGKGGIITISKAPKAKERKIKEENSAR